jgi:RNA polymerase sigma-32 factor
MVVRSQAGSTIRKLHVPSRDVQMETTLDSVSPHQRLDGASAPQQPDQLVEERQLESAVSERMAQVVATMTTRDRAIFDERIVAEKPTTLNELGARFGVSRERTRQLEERLKKRLRPLFREFREGPPADLADGATGWGPAGNPGSSCGARAEST